MAQATGRIITNRRAFVAGAAAVIALPVSGASGRTPDPIFAAIEAHKQSAVRFDACLGRQSALEQVIPHDKRSVWADAETDDPRWSEAKVALDEASDEMYAIARDLLQTDITTVAGVVAFLDYIVRSTCEDDNYCFPEFAEDDNDDEHFAGPAMRHASASLARIAV